MIGVDTPLHHLDCVSGTPRQRSRQFTDVRAITREESLGFVESPPRCSPHVVHRAQTQNHRPAPTRSAQPVIIVAPEAGLGKSCSSGVVVEGGLVPQPFRARANAITRRGNAVALFTRIRRKAGDLQPGRVAGSCRYAKRLLVQASSRVGTSPGSAARCPRWRSSWME